MATQTKDLVTKVWIEEGCIVCDACETSAPTVFEVTEDTCIIRPSALSAEFTKPLTDSIVEAAEECPVDVIKFDTVPGEVTADEAAGADSEAEPASAPEAPAESATAAVAEAPAPAKSAPPKAPKAAPAVEAPAPVAAMATSADTTMELLLKAAKARGGRAGMEKGGNGRTGTLPDRFAQVPVDELPPDARHARIVEAGKEAAKKPEASRREAMKAGSLIAGLGWACVGGAGATSAVALGRFLMPNITEEPDPKVRVGELSKYADMKPGEVNEDFKPQGIWMIRLEDRIAALNIICTHLGCIPNWLANDRKFKCPCHGSGYRQDGTNFEGPTPRPLERFKIYVEEGVVVVDKSRKFQKELGQWTNPDSFFLV